jgi:hypothetical protein
MGWEAPFESLALGRLVKWVGFFALLAIFAALLLVYLRLSGGQLPFAFRDLAGVPPWAPFLATWAASSSPPSPHGSSTRFPHGRRRFTTSRRAIVGTACSSLWRPFSATG